MPYVTRDERALVDDSIDKLLDVLQHTDSSGVRNYTLLRVLVEGEKPYRTRRWSYEQLERVLGRIEAVKAEVIRRLYNPKEKQSQDDNGDIDCLKYNR